MDSRYKMNRPGHRLIISRIRIGLGDDFWGEFPDL